MVKLSQTFQAKIDPFLAFFGPFWLGGQPKL
jgi:hypothetical protein